MQGAWILIVAVTISLAALVGTLLFLAVRCAWKRKQNREENRTLCDRKRKVAITRQFVPNFHIPDAIPMYVQTAEEEHEEYDPSQQRLVQPTTWSSQDYRSKALSLHDLNDLPQRARFLSSSAVLEAERTSARHHSFSMQPISASTLPGSGYRNTPSRRSIVDLTIPGKGIRVSRQRSLSEQDLSKMVQLPASSAETGVGLQFQERGKITFEVFHNEEERKLHVHLINAIDLPLRNTELLDSFVKLSLKSATKRKSQAKYQTKLVRKSCNPIFNERLEFAPVNVEDLSNTSLKIKVFHRESFTSRDRLVGETLVELSDPEVLGQESVIRNLVPRINRQQRVAGELMVSVCHQATSAQLKVSVIKVRDLPKPNKAAFVTVQLCSKDQVLQTEEAKPKKSRNGIVFNDLFVFNIHTCMSRTLENFGVTFTVYTRDLLRNKEIIGCVNLSDDAPSASERKHWKKVKFSPLKTVAEWHKLHEVS